MAAKVSETGCAPPKSSPTDKPDWYRAISKYEQPDPSKAGWQLVDTFSLVDADMVRIHESPTLLHVQLDPIADIEFPNRDVIYQSVTKF